MGTANSVSPLASPENERTTSPCSTTDASAKGAGSANHFVPITHPPCRTCGMPMRLGLIDPLDEPRRERRVYECLPCEDSVNFVITIP
jgi:hypothetical protein